MFEKEMLRETPDIWTTEIFENNMNNKHLVFVGLNNKQAQKKQ